MVKYYFNKFKINMPYLRPITSIQHNKYIIKNKHIIKTSILEYDANNTIQIPILGSLISKRRQVITYYSPSKQKVRVLGNSITRFHNIKLTFPSFGEEELRTDIQLVTILSKHALVVKAYSLKGKKSDVYLDDIPLRNEYVKTSNTKIG